jgi:hypothetical protein
MPKAREVFHFPLDLDLRKGNIAGFTGIQL